MQSKDLTTPFSYVTTDVMPWCSTGGVDSKVSYGDLRTAISNYAATQNPVYNNARVFDCSYRLNGDYAAGDMVAGVALTGTDGSVLLSQQIVLRYNDTNKQNNGLWQIQPTGAAVRYSKANTGGLLMYSVAMPNAGTYKGKWYKCTNYAPNIGTDAIEYAEIFAPTQSLNTTDSPTFNALNTTGLATLDTAKIGDVAGGNYSEFESDGTLVGKGDATCYMDVIIPMFLRGVPSEPEAIAFPLNGIGLQPRFRVDNILTLQNAEAPHDWEEGSAIEIHMHFSNGSQDATDRYIKFTLEYAIANMVANGNTNTQFVRGTQDVEILIPANTPAYTHLYATLKVIDATAMTGIKIGAGFVGSIKRITAVGTAPSVNPYVLNLGIHYKANTLGSRTTTSK